jgi:hypothetical protein
VQARTPICAWLAFINPQNPAHHLDNVKADVLLSTYPDHHPLSTSNLSSITTPPGLATPILAPPEAFESKFTPPSTTKCISSPTDQYFPDNLEVASIGSLTVENYSKNSMDCQLAPEYSQETLDYYNDIQYYLQHLKVDGTEKKKKKKTTVNSGSESSWTSSSTVISPLPVVSPTDTAVKTTTVMDEEALKTLKKKKANPTSTPDNPILFYV